MADTYLTREGDVLDWVVWKYYGTTSNRSVERVIESNPGLANYGPLLPAGVRITLPDLPPPTTQQGVRLWD